MYVFITQNTDVEAKSMMKEIFMGQRRYAARICPTGVFIQAVVVLTGLASTVRAWGLPQRCWKFSRRYLGIFIDTNCHPRLASLKQVFRVS